MQLQFHHHGYRPGTPPSFATHPGTAPPAANTLPSTVDVLIIGAGAAGLVLATQLSRFPLTTALAEQRPSRLLVGQADGIQCRSIEMFAAFGFAERVLREAYWVNETVFWKPGADGIERSGRIRDVERGLSEFPHVILNQARVGDMWLDEMARGMRPVAPVYGRRLRSVRVHREAEAKGEKFPVEAVMEVLEDGEETGRTETVRAQYVVGCDGARSSVRKELGLSLKGDSANAAWGVMDILCVTSFPDIRLKSVIHSKDHGSMIIIPREGGHLVRLYIELDSAMPAGQRVDKEKMTAEMLIDAAKAIFAPHTLDVKQVAWWSVYEIGQRLCDQFDDSMTPGDDTVRNPRIFIAGDACHTHSPKAGQGMNVGMQDGFNLAWKLGAVIRGHARPDLLRTYQSERHAVAKVLIDFDRELTAMLSGKHDGGHVDPAAFQAHFTKSGRYTAGLGYAYGDSAVIALKASQKWQHLAAGFAVGERFHSAEAVRLWDAKPVQLGHAVVADGRWRIFVFNDETEPWDRSGRLPSLCQSLSALARRYTPCAEDIDEIIEVLFVLQQGHAQLQEALVDTSKTLPELFAPEKKPFGLKDMHKVFCDEEPYHHIFGVDGAWQSVYKCRSVSKTEGAVVVVRPDGYVAGVCSLEAEGQRFLDSFFAGFMRNIQADIQT